jgi:hypothetical protein
MTVPELRRNSYPNTALALKIYFRRVVTSRFSLNPDRGSTSTHTLAQSGYRLKPSFYEVRAIKKKMGVNSI